MLIQLKRDRPKRARFLLDCTPGNVGMIQNHTTLLHIEEALELVAARAWWSKIDITAVYHNICFDWDSEQQTTFLSQMWHDRTRIMEREERNARATMVRAMNEIFTHIIEKDLIIYIDDIIISNSNYKDHVAAIHRVGQQLQDEPLWLKQSKWDFFTRLLDILRHILILEGRSA